MNPIPADAGITQAPSPMGIDFTAQAGLDHLGSLADQDPGSHRHHKTQPLQRLVVAQFGILPAKAVGFVVEEPLLDSESTAMIGQRLGIGLVVAEHPPGFLGPLLPTDRHMGLFMDIPQINPMPVSYLSVFDATLQR